MPEGQQPSGETWNTESDIRNTYPELNQKDSVGAFEVSATAINNIIGAVEGEVKDQLRDHWDVDDTDFFGTDTIDTFAKSVKSIARQIIIGRVLRYAVWGSKSGGTEAGAEAREMETEGRAKLDKLIATGRLGVERRTDKVLPGTHAGAAAGPDDIDANTDTGIFGTGDETSWSDGP